MIFGKKKLNENNKGINLETNINRHLIDYESLWENLDVHADYFAGKTNGLIDSVTQNKKDEIIRTYNELDETTKQIILNKLSLIELKAKKKYFKKKIKDKNNEQIVNQLYDTLIAVSKEIYELTCQIANAYGKQPEGKKSKSFDFFNNQTLTANDKTYIMEKRAEIEKRSKKEEYYY